MTIKMLAAVLGLVFTATFLAFADDHSTALSSEAATAIFNKFPSGKVLHIEIEEDVELDLFEVELLDKGVHHDVKVTKTGLILTVETETPLKFSPDPVQKSLAAFHNKAKISEVTKVEVLVDMKVKTLEKAKTVYHVTIERNGLIGHAKVSADGVLKGPVFWKTPAKKHQSEEHDDNKDEGGDGDEDEELPDDEEDFDLDDEIDVKQLPDLCVKAFKKAHPKGNIQSIHRHTELSHTVYEVSFLEGTDLKHTAIVDTGVILELEVSIKVNQLPAAVCKTLLDLYGKVTIGAANKETICAEIQTIPLKEHLVYYEALLSHDGKEAEVAVMSNGDVLAKPEWREPEHDDHDHDHPHEDRDKEDDE